MKLSRRVGVLSALTAVLASAVVVSGPAIADPTPPPNPSDGQIQAAQAQKDAAAKQVGELSAQLAYQQQQILLKQAQQEAAEQKVAYALSELQKAKDKVEAARQTAVSAKAAVQKAQNTVDQAQRNYVLYVNAVYTSGDVEGTTGMLLTADDPSDMLEAATIQRYQASHELTAIDDMRRATVAKSNADAAARQAVIDEQSAEQAKQKLADEADQARQAAVAAVQQAEADEVALQAQQAQTQQALQQAQLLVAELNNQKQTYLAYVAEQKRIAEEKARQKRIAEAKAAAAAKLAAQRAAAAEAAQEAADRKKAADSGSSGGSSSSGSSHTISSGGGHTVAQGGSWNAARGQRAANRALAQLGIRYSWAAGDADGPTYGFCATGTDGWNDCHVYGYDCSGLALYAWAPYIDLPHYSASQYYQAGSFHPSPDQLMPGDLLFWSTNSNPDNIHHVAIYIGNGNVVQAPNSGDVVKVTPWRDIPTVYIGATRPLTS